MMRIGGLASGIDTETMIKELMNAERIPLDKLEQNKTKMEWQRDKYREINTQIAEVEQLIADMRTNSSMISGKSVSSSMENAVTATGNADAINGAYKVTVSRLASNAINVGEADRSTIENWIKNNVGEKVSFYTFDEKENQMKERSFHVSAGDTVESLVKKINDADKNIRAFYDEPSGKLVMETTRSGDYNQTERFGGAEIGFNSQDSSSFFVDILGMRHRHETGGKDAEFTYNNRVTLYSKENRYTLNGITFNFHDVTGDKSASLTVTNDVDTAFENISKLVDKYNELIETLNGTQNEPRYRDYPPLTEVQKEEMTEKQIELWEEKAKSGLLKGEPLISGALTNMRSIWYSKVENNSVFTQLTEIGITTTRDYLDGGKLEIDEDKLREKLEEDTAGVHALLLTNEQGAERGLLNRLEDSLELTIKSIEKQAGKGSFTNEQFTLGKRMNELDDRISAFEDRMKKTEDRYWRQFAAMERAISMMNNQSAMLMSFGGNMNQ